MWEHIISCFKKGGRGGSSKACKTVNLTDLYNRVPPNQRQQFQLFLKKHEEYKRRVVKYPGNMPKIDWAYYKQNVRPQMVNWVKDFQRHYDLLDSLFEDRYTMIDHESYFPDVDRQTAETKLQVNEYKKQSNERIRILQERIDYLKQMKPYEEMTMEEFCFARPELAPDFINTPTFWPHTPEEQKPGPMEEHVHEDEAGGETNSAGDEKPPTTPPAAPPPANVAPAAPSEPKPAAPPASPAPPTSERSEEPSTKAECIKLLQCEEKTSDKISADGSRTLAPTGQEKQLEKTLEDATAELSAKGTELAAKGAEFINDLTEKCSAFLKSQLEKVCAKRIEIEKEMANDKLRQTKTNERAASPAKGSMQQANKISVFEDEDSFHVREASKSILNQTIIRGEQLVKPDVKSQHVNLDGKQKYKEREEDEDDCLCAEATEEEKCDEDQEQEQEQEQERVQTTCEKDCNSSKSVDACAQILSKCPNKSNYAKKMQDDTNCPKSLKSDYVSTPAEVERRNDSVSSIRSDETTQRMLDTTTLGTERSRPAATFEQPAEATARKANMPQNTALGSTKHLSEHDKHLTEFSDIDLRSSASNVKDPKATTDDTAQQKANEMKTPATDCTEDCEPVYSSTGQTRQLYREMGMVSPRSHKPEGIQEAEAKKLSIQTNHDFEDFGLDTEVKEEPTMERMKQGDDMASSVFLMVTEAAKLLKQASNMVDHLKDTKSSRIEIIEATYLAARTQADRVISEANKAIAAAEKLRKRSRNITELDDTKATIMAEKHIELAKMLINRALNVKHEITNMMEKLKSSDNFK